MKLFSLKIADVIMPCSRAQRSIILWHICPRYRLFFNAALPLAHHAWNRPRATRARTHFGGLADGIVNDRALPGAPIVGQVNMPALWFLISSRCWPPPYLPLRLLHDLHLLLLLLLRRVLTPSHTRTTPPQKRNERIQVPVERVVSWQGPDGEKKHCRDYNRAG